jgi:hypothetical protein
VQQETTHSSRYFAVIPGLNKFTYQIKRDNEVVESGMFIANMTVETRVDRQAEDLRSDSTAPTSSPFDPAPNQCEQPSIPDIKVPEIPDIKMPDIPTLQLPDMPSTLP